MTSPMRCPCGSGEEHARCCQRYHRGARPPTANELMRSRFSAFAIADAAYLLDSWHPSTRPAKLDLDVETRWTFLEIVETVRGGPFDAAGTVEFRAHYQMPGGRGVLSERSSFTREKGRWWYLSGQSL
jgi:SEC-C motif-containing protein